MKNFFLTLCLIMASVCGMAQKPLRFEQIVQVENKAAKEIYFAAKEFISTAYNSAQNATQLDNPETNTMIIKAVYMLKYGTSTTPTDGPISYTLKIQSRDGRYKIEIFDFYHNSSLTTAFKETWSLFNLYDNRTSDNKYLNGKIYKSANQKIFDEIETHFQGLIKNAETVIERILTQNNDDNW